jgi:hypothetical protein
VYTISADFIGYLTKDGERVNETYQPIFIYKLKETATPEIINFPLNDMGEENLFQRRHITFEIKK